MEKQEFKGFKFNNFIRNEELKKKGFKPLKFQKTGTTICGVVFKDGVVLGADTRATEGPIVADKNCKKIHYIAPNIYCGGAGTAADTENMTGMVSSQLALLRLATGKESRVVSACTILRKKLFQYMGYVVAALILGGVDVNGPQLFMIHPHGSSNSAPFLTMGSGSLAAMSVLESGFKKDMSQDEAINLVHNAIKAGIMNDLYSGSNVDICIIKKNDVKFIRGFDTSTCRILRRPYDLQIGTTFVISEKVEFFKKKALPEKEEKNEKKEKNENKMVDE